MKKIMVGVVVLVLIVRYPIAVVITQARHVPHITGWLGVGECIDGLFDEMIVIIVIERHTIDSVRRFIVTIR